MWGYWKIIKFREGTVISLRPISLSTPIHPFSILLESLSGAQSRGHIGQSLIRILTLTSDNLEILINLQPCVWSRGENQRTLRKPMKHRKNIQTPHTQCGDGNRTRNPEGKSVTTTPPQLWLFPQNITPYSLNGVDVCLQKINFLYLHIFLSLTDSIIPHRCRLRSGTFHPNVFFSPELLRICGESGQDVMNLLPQTAGLKNIWIDIFSQYSLLLNLKKNTF